jgi:hypothetical protein
LEPPAGVQTNAVAVPAAALRIGGYSNRGPELADAVSTVIKENPKAEQLQCSQIKRDGDST